MAEPEIVERVIVTGDSSSGAIPVHIQPDKLTEIIVISDYHYYRSPMAEVESFPLAGDDAPIVKEIGTMSECEIVDGPTVRDSASWRLLVRAPAARETWIYSARTKSVPEELHGRTYAGRSRTVQLRITTKPPIGEYIETIR